MDAGLEDRWLKGTSLTCHNINATNVSSFHKGKEIKAYYFFGIASPWRKFAP